MKELKKFGPNEKFLIKQCKRVGHENNEGLLLYLFVSYQNFVLDIVKKLFLPYARITDALGLK